MGFLFRLWSVFENTIRIISIMFYTFYFLSDGYLCSQGTDEVILWKFSLTISFFFPFSPRINRRSAIARESDGFVYCVSSLGVTGVRSEITTNIKEMVDTVKQGRDVPCAIGFGISTPEQAGRMASQADGVIVGSAIVKMVARYGINCVEPVCDYVKQMKAAVGV